MPLYCCQIGRCCQIGQKQKPKDCCCVMGLQTGQLVDGGSTLSSTQVSDSKNKFSGLRADTVASYQKMLWWQRSGKWGGCGLVAIIQSSGLSLAEREGGEDKFLASLPLSQLLLLLMSNLTPCYPDIRNIFICLNTWGSFGREKYCLHNFDYSILCVLILIIFWKTISQICQTQ